MEKRKVINISIFFVAIVAIIFGVSFYYKLDKLQDKEEQVAEKQKQVKKEIDSVISKVSLLYLFPEGETPTIATVSDPLLLKDNAFFKMSQIGDKVLIFSKSGVAVLYRPSIDRIIETTSIQINSNNENTVKSKEQKTN